MEEQRRHLCDDEEISKMNQDSKSSVALTATLCLLEGSLLRSSCPFAYFFLLAFEAGSIIRAFLVLLVYPVALLSKHLVSDSMFISILVFVTTSGLKKSTIELVSRGVLTKFYLDDMGWKAYEALLKCNKRHFVTSLPRIMVNYFLEEYLEAEQVIGSELHTICGGTYCSGLLSRVMDQAGAVETCKKVFYDWQPDLGIGRQHNSQLLDLCKQKLVLSDDEQQEQVARTHYLKPLIFQDGRLAVRPSPITALTIFLWLPVGTVLVLVRAVFVVISPHIGTILLMQAALGVTLRFTGSPPSNSGGHIFVCSHRTVLDPIILSGMLFRRIAAVTYSISRITEFLSPIKTVRLSRCRIQDAETMQRHLAAGDMIVCPEGTTCREPYLLRFSKLFVELAAGRAEVVPVAMACKVQLFHGTSVRGWKALDPFFFALNPWPEYVVHFLEPVDLRHLVPADCLHELANDIQRRIGDALGFDCTRLTRRDKYQLLAGHEGIAAPHRRRRRREILRTLVPTYTVRT